MLVVSLLALGIASICFGLYRLIRAFDVFDLPPRLGSGSRAPRRDGGRRDRPAYGGKRAEALQGTFVGRSAATKRPFIYTVTWTFVRLLRFLSGRFDHNDACRVDEPSFDEITLSGGATTATLPAPHRNAWFIDV